jgi:hypothetical protein
MVRFTNKAKHGKTTANISVNVWMEIRENISVVSCKFKPFFNKQLIFFISYLGVIISMAWYFRHCTCVKIIVLKIIILNLK